jgi:rare lipoprotein A (peptidoglycan hydrolase)
MMKRLAASAGILLLAALSLAAAVWDGSAVSGVAGDFPGDGLYGACNSFPKDTSVTVTNLENGKTVTVTVTAGNDNPGVFIALSPKAAAELGMRAGSAARIRAVAMTASQAETSLPPTRAGETADPDFNPKVYVEREKAAVKAAAASKQLESAAVASAPALAEAQSAATAAALPKAAPKAPETGKSSRR